MLRLIAKYLGSRTVRSGVVLILWLLAALSAIPSSAESPTGKVLLLADIHFDPLADPAVVPRLIREDVSQWPAIFADPSSLLQKYIPIYSGFVNELCDFFPHRPSWPPAKC